MRPRELRPRSFLLPDGSSSCPGSGSRLHRRRSGGQQGQPGTSSTGLRGSHRHRGLITTTGRLTMAPVPRMATCGWLMIGVSKSAPLLPVLVMVNAPPARSSGVILLFRVRSATFAMARARPAMLRSPAALDNRDDESLVRVHGDGEVLGAVMDHLVALDARVDHRVRLEGLGRGERQEGQEAELDVFARQEVVLRPLPDPGHLRQVDLDDGGQLCRDLQRLDHPRRDELAQARAILSRVPRFGETEAAAELPCWR